jgi:bacterioferritin-associated ferredoxin
MIVCLCRGVTERKIDAVVADGAKTVGDVTRACGAGSDCGACYQMLAELLDDARRAEPASGERT